MSEDKKELDIANNFPPDFDKTLSESVSLFIQSGLPGLAEHVKNPKTVSKLITLYLQGNSFQEISTALGMPVEMVGFLIYKHKLYDLKQKTIDDLSLTIADKIKILKLKHFNFLVHSAYQIMDHYTNEFSKLSSPGTPNRPKSIDEIDSEWLKLYFKIMDSLLSDQEQNKSSIPAINLQLPQNSKIKKELDGSVSILNEPTPEQQKAITDILAYIAELKRNQQNN